MKKLFASLLMACVLINPGNAFASNKKTINLSDSNTINLNGVVDDASVGSVLLQAKELDQRLSNTVRERLGKPKAPIYVFLYTPGGSIQKGLELIDALNSLGRPVHTVTLFAASMGFQIAQNLGERYVLENGILMSHQAAGGMEGSFGPAVNQLNSRYRFWMDRIQSLDRKTVERTNGKQTLESYQKAYDHEMWRSGPQSVEEGYADEVVNATCDSSLDGVKTSSVEFFGMTVLYDTANCPMNTSLMNIRMQITTNKGVMEVNSFLAKGGVFGLECKLNPNTDALCASDPNITLEKIEQVKKIIIEKRDFKNHVEPMVF